MDITKFKIDTPKEQFAFRKVFRIEPINPPIATWEELHETRSKINKAAENLLTLVEAEKRALTPEENAGYELGMELLDCINGEFERREKANTKEPINDTRTFNRPDSNLKPKSVNRLSSESRKYRGMFEGRIQITDAGFETMEDFLRVVNSGRADKRLEDLEARTYVAGSGPKGGFAVPALFTEQIYDQSLEAEIVRPRARVYPMTEGMSIFIPAWSHKDHSTSLYAGYTADWGSENSSATVQSGKLRLMEMKLQKLRLYTEVSREAERGGIGFEEQIGRSLTNSLGFFMDEAFLNGNGVGKPLGVLNSDACIKVSRAGATAISYTDVVNMFGRLAPSVSNGAVWVCNHSLIPRLLTMKDDSSALVWQPVHGTGIAGGITMSLFGKPILITEKTPTLGGTGDLMLCAFSEYAIALAPTMALENSNAPGWDRDVQSWRGIVLVNGQPLWDEPITPRDGSTNTLSPFIALSSST